MNATEWLSRLIAYDTVSRHSNLELIDAIEKWLQHHGITSRKTFARSEPKANLFATIPAKNGEISGGILLSGHTDVVPVDGQDWKTNPFEALITDEKIYGRGASDMKGFLAVILALIPEFLKLELHQPIHFAFSFDEEIGCRGAPLLIEDLKAANIKPRTCIVGEPTNMQVVVAHKGIHVFRCRVHGKARHSSLTTKGCNAVTHAAKLIGHIQQLADQCRENGPFDDHYDVPFTTISTNLIHGGNAYNIIPEHCEFIFEFRNLPNVDVDQLENNIRTYIDNKLQPLMHREYNKANVELNRLASVPSFKNASSEFVKNVQRLVHDDGIHKVSYATEAGLFQHADIETIVCGPGSIDEAHGADEFVTIDQLRKCEKFLRRVVVKKS